MSKTMLLAEDVPQYIREIVKNLRLDTRYEEDDVPGYTFRLYGKHRVGYESQLSSDCEKLLAWCKRHYADAYVVGEHFWFTDVPAPHDFGGDLAHQRKAYELGYHNYIKVVITDPVALRFENDRYYREREPLAEKINAAQNASRNSGVSPSFGLVKEKGFERE